MIISAIRFRTQGQGEWHAFKLSLGTGRLRDVQCIVAPAPVLQGLAKALAYGLLGEQPAELSEVAVQLSDDAGHAWTVQRRGAQTRVLRDGAPLGDDGEDRLAAALLDLESGAAGAAVAVARFEVHPADDGLAAVPLGQPGSAREGLRAAALRQIGEVAKDCARAVGLDALSEPKLLARLARQLEPLLSQYKELCRQYAQLTTEAKAAVPAAGAALPQLTAELELLTGLAEAAAPLLVPGVSLKALKDELAAVDAEIAECCAGLGIEAQDGRQLPRDFRKPLEALSRLEAYAKLIRAAQGARKYCAQNVEPPFRRYLEAAEGSLAGDRQVIAELEGCLASLTLRLRDRRLPEPAAAAEAGAGVKTWFDRFKSRQEAEERQLADQASAQAAAEAAAQDIEAARLATQFALSRLTELGAGASAARERHDTTLAALDEANEELVRSYGRLREHWLVVARESHLPEELDLNGLMRIVGHHGRLAALCDRRTELGQRVRRYGAQLAKVERLLLEWRKSTGSQKTVELGNATILLAEARDVLRYHDAKRQRLAALRGEAGEVNTTAALQAMLKARRTAVAAAWRDAFAAHGLAALPLAHPSVTELLAGAELVKALALVHGAASGAGAAPLFAGQAGVVAALYLWEDPRIPAKQRLAFLSQLEAAEGGGLRLLLLADPGLAAMLAPLGVGQATALATQSGPATQPGPADAGRGALAAPPLSREGRGERGLGARPTAMPAVRAQATAPARTPPPAALLNERARQALEMLSGKKG